MTVRLYYHPLASFCWKALIALYENETPFEPILVDLGDDAQAMTLILRADLAGEGEDRLDDLRIRIVRLRRQNDDRLGRQRPADLNLTRINGTARAADHLHPADVGDALTDGVIHLHRVARGDDDDARCARAIVRQSELSDDREYRG